jgi:hypothetical protein
VRLPRIQAAADVDKDNQWLPKLAPLVTLPIPVLTKEPWRGIPMVLVGLSLIERNRDHRADCRFRQAATEMAQFIAALHGRRCEGCFSHHNSFEVYHWQPETPQPAPLSRTCAERSMKAPERSLDTALNAPVWNRRRSDPRRLQPGNCRSKAVAQCSHRFRCLGVGDPACDLNVESVHANRAK